jgi:hypothetical protein
VGGKRLGEEKKRNDKCCGSDRKDGVQVAATRRDCMVIRWNDRFVFIEIGVSLLYDAHCRGDNPPGITSLTYRAKGVDSNDNKKHAY